MTWWYENKEEGMKLYKNEDLCIECKNEFFSKPYDHRDPTPGQLGYCIKCDNCLIKEQKEDNMNWNYESLPERQEMGVSDHVIVAVEGCPYGQSGYYDYDMQAWFVDGCSEPVKVEAWQKVELPKIEKAEKKYRPFKDTDELIKVWEQKFGKVLVAGIELTMPLIWVRRKDVPVDRGYLITGFDISNVIICNDDYSMGELFNHYTFLDGSICGVEE